jgi:uncharacterized phage protein (TIGR02216 family)
MSGRLDWPGLMRAGMRGLGLRPDQFWALTPAELALMLGEASGTAPLSRGRLEQLAAQWPDKPAVPAELPQDMRERSKE